MMHSDDEDEKESQLFPKCYFRSQLASSLAKSSLNCSKSLIENLIALQVVN